MSVKICVVLLGLIYLFMGITGFLTGWIYAPPPQLQFYNMHVVGHWGYWLTWLPVNPIHNILYLLIGGGAVMAAPSYFLAKWGLRVLFFLTFVLMVAGLMPQGADHTWGLLPLFSWNVMVHCVTAVLAYYYGFIYPLDTGGSDPAGEWRPLHV